jgi:hypothetical protein
VYKKSASGPLARSGRAGVLTGIVLGCGLAVGAANAAPGCPAGVDPTASTPLATATTGTSCSPRTSHGYPLPDPACTPGAINPTITLAVLQSGRFKTPCERDRATSAAQKATTYAEYGVPKPGNNTGQNQTCELDHLVSLELGGADTLDNIWPQCGPPGAKLPQRYFKIKDGVENYLAAEVRAGAITLAAAQHGIATDWTQYIAAAHGYWKGKVPRGFGRDSLN